MNASKNAVSSCDIYKKKLYFKLNYIRKKNSYLKNIKKKFVQIFLTCIFFRL